MNVTIATSTKLGLVPRCACGFVCTFEVTSRPCRTLFVSCHTPASDIRTADMKNSSLSFPTPDTGACPSSHDAMTSWSAEMPVPRRVEQSRGHHAFLRLFFIALMSVEIRPEPTLRQRKNEPLRLLPKGGCIDSTLLFTFP